MSWGDDISGLHREIAGSREERIGVLASPGTDKPADMA